MSPKHSPFLPFRLTNRRMTSDPGFATKMIDEVLAEGITRCASDIHIAPRADHWEVLFRCDGVLLPFRDYPKDPQSDPVARLMAMAALPSYRGNVPQEASLRFSHHAGLSGQVGISDHDGVSDNAGQLNRDTEMRVGIFPTVHGHRATIRINSDHESIRSLDHLGLDIKTVEALKSGCQSRDGLILMTGPAGSGKTTTLYACLTHITPTCDDSTDGRRSVLTIEDPVESILPRVHQSSLQTHVGGLTLADAMRAAVRQDAEVLLVSEVRDNETAAAVLSASMTGHLCFSSLHAGSVGTALRRLVQMDLPTYALASGLRAIVLTRLLRTLCQACDGKSRECAICHGSGYSGRTAIGQYVGLQGTDVGDAVFTALSKEYSARQIDGLVQEMGTDDLMSQAMACIDQGRTDAAEVARVLGANPTDAFSESP